MQPTKSNSALLVTDMQNSVVPRYVQDENALIPFQKAIEAARYHNITVIYIRVGFRPGYPEISMKNKMFGGVVSRSGNIAVPEELTQIHQSVQPEPNDLIVNKVRVSGFSGSDLEVILRSMEIDTLILSGIATSGVVLSTLREAADKDYYIKVLSDACIDGDLEVHQVLMEKVFPMQADVVTVQQWVSSLNHESKV